MGEAVRLQFSVADTGIGITPDKLKAVFEPFTQADGSTTRKYGGTGLGLTISLRLVELMGGRIWAESEAGKGSTFLFEVRFESGASGSLERDSRVSRPIDLKGLPILIVDDNRDQPAGTGRNGPALGCPPDVRVGQRAGGD